MLGRVLPVASITPGAHAACSCLEGTGVRGEEIAFDDESQTRTFGHLPGVTGQSEAGHVGDGVDGLPGRPKRVRGLPVQRPHPGRRTEHRLLVARGQGQSAAKWL